MAFDAGQLKPVVFNFASGNVTVYASNREYADLAMYLLNVLALEDGAAAALHTPTKTKHRTLGALTSITLP